MRILDVRKKEGKYITNLEKRYTKPEFYREMGSRTDHFTTDADIKEFEKQAEKEGAEAIFIYSRAQVAYIPLKKAVPKVESGRNGKKSIQVGDRVKSSVWKGIEGNPWLTVLGVYRVSWQGQPMLEVEVTDGVTTNRVFEDTITEHQPGIDKLPQTEFGREDDLLQYYKVPPSAF